MAPQYPESPKTPGAGQRIAMVGTLADTILGFRGELIRDMVRAGHQVYAFATDYTPETERAILAIGAMPVRYSMGRLSTNPVRDLVSMWQLYRLFRSYNITCSFAYFTKPSIWGTTAAWLAGVPLRVAKIEGMGRVFTPGPGGFSLKQRILQKVIQTLFRTSLSKAHHLLVLNHDDERELKAMGLTRPAPNMIGGIGVCLEQYPLSPPVDSTVKFIFVGRLIPEKGVRYFIEAARALKQRYPNTEFVVLGAPDDKRGVSKAELQKLVDSGIVSYPGAVENVPHWLAQSSVFVLPSYYREGVPRSTQEALAMGRPVITTNMPGCRETVQHGVNGYLVAPHNQHELEAAMLQFIQHPEQIAPMGQASHKLAVERFNVRKINQTVLTTLGLTKAEQGAELNK
ncbi:glycosyltransferase family 4 protein [Marinobacter vinifirmus]|uniref:glycosyltransferase family 4 protein n=1 Tax=Marinobacter vinifirmus TaxID=355591 RepID=UPI00235439D6|nr:glycosyltransferase family 4 protein [Marinobacter vinifirmus]